MQALQQKKAKAREKQYEKDAWSLESRKTKGK